MRFACPSVASRSSHAMEFGLAKVILMGAWKVRQSLVGSELDGSCRGQPFRGTTLSFPDLSRWQPAVKLVRSYPVVPMHQKMAQILLSLLSRRVAPWLASTRFSGL